MRLRRLTAPWSRPGAGRGDNIAREGHGAPGDNSEGGGAEGSEGGDDSSHSSHESSAVNPPINDSDSEDSSGSDDDDDDSDVDLHPGFLAFLSTQQAKIEDDISAVANRLRGEGGRFPGASPLFQISFVREYVRDDGAAQIARAMEEGCSSCHHDDTIDSEGASTLLPQSLPRWCPNYHIREIVFSRCHIGDRGAGALARAISNSCTPSLNTLDLSSNNITGAGVACLADCLVSRDAMDGGMNTLVLSSNPIGSDGGIFLANALRGRRPEDDNSDVGFCCLKKLHISGCRLNDDDAIALGDALLPDCSGSVPSLPKTHHLTLLNVHSNCITTRGMEHLYSIIMALGPDEYDAESDGLQSLFCKSNHAVDLGVVVDYGTRDYNYGHHFDQEEDELLLARMREYEMTGAEPNNIEELKAQMVRKLSLVHKMMDALHVNRQCIVAVRKEEAASTNVPHTLTEECQRILCAGSRKKIARVIEQKLNPRPLTLPRRQDEYGKYLENDIIGLSSYQSCHSVVAASSTIGKLFSSLDLNLFPCVISWVHRRFCRHDGRAILFDILRENPDVFSYRHATTAGKRWQK